MALDAEDQHHDDAEQALSTQPKQSDMVNNKTCNDDALRNKDLNMVSQITFAIFNSSIGLLLMLALAANGHPVGYH